MFNFNAKIEMDISQRHFRRLVKRELDSVASGIEEIEVDEGTIKIENDDDYSHIASTSNHVSRSLFS